MAPVQDTMTMATTKAIEKYINNLVTNSSMVQSAAAIRIAPPDQTGPKKGSLVVQKGNGIRAQEASFILERFMQGTLHRDYVYACGAQYTMTSVHERSVYGRLTSMNAKGGIAVVKTRRLVIVATYAAPVLPSEAIPYVEKFCDDLVKNGY